MPHKTVTYKMMDQQTLLCRCMHGGKIPLADAARTVPNVSQHVVESFLRKVVETYGSCAVLALEGETIVGVLWFYPQWLKQRLGGICLQDENDTTLAQFDVTTLPAFDELPTKTLCIECMMVVNSENGDYTGRGIGKGMIEYLIAWAKQTGWQHIEARAIPDIKPLRLWAGAYTVTRYQALGFEIVPEKTQPNPGLLEGAKSQKLGYHGPEFQQMWERHYADLTDDEISRDYTLRLAL